MCSAIDSHGSEHGRKGCRDEEMFGKDVEHRQVEANAWSGFALLELNK
jgi:hypothetical protein